MPNAKCLVCQAPITGRRKKCPACKSTCPNCKTLMDTDKKGYFCRACRNSQAKAWRNSNPKRSRAIEVASRYGVSIEDATELVSRMVCGVCGDGPGAKALHVDHDHATGKVRGVLCNHCNLALGHCKDDPERLRALADYLEVNKSA